MLLSKNASFIMKNNAGYDIPFKTAIFSLQKNNGLPAIITEHYIYVRLR